MYMTLKFKYAKVKWFVRDKNFVSQKMSFLNFVCYVSSYIDISIRLFNKFKNEETCFVKYSESLSRYIKIYTNLV